VVLPAVLMLRIRRQYLAFHLPKLMSVLHSLGLLFTETVSNMSKIGRRGEHHGRRVMMVTNSSTKVNPLSSLNTANDALLCLASATT